MNSLFRSTVGLKSRFEYMARASTLKKFMVKLKQKSPTMQLIMKKTAVTFILLISINSHLFANENGNSLTRGLGVCAGIMGGNGFSYLYLPVDGYGFHTAGLLIKTDDLSYLSLGIAPLKVLHKGNRTAMYLVSGIGLKFEKETKYHYHWDDEMHRQTETETIENNNTISFGAGIGGVYQSNGRLTANVEFIMAVWEDRIIPVPQAGFYYLLW